MKNYTVSDFKTVTPIYTGGNIYIFFGQLQDGSFFIADDNFSVRLLSGDPSAAGDDAWFSGWQEAHLLRDLESNDESLAFITSMIDWVIRHDGNCITEDMKAIKNEAESLKGTTDWR